MSNCNFCDNDFDTLGTNSGSTCGCDPVSDLTLSSMVVGNQGVMLNKLIMILLFLYAYTNQNFISHLMCVNEKMMENQMCLTCKLLENALDSLEDCRKGNRHCCKH